MKRHKRYVFYFVTHLMLLIIRNKMQCEKIKRSVKDNVKWKSKQKKAQNEEQKKRKRKLNLSHCSLSVFSHSLLLYCLSFFLFSLFISLCYLFPPLSLPFSLFIYVCSFSWEETRDKRVDSWRSFQSDDGKKKKKKSTFKVRLFTLHCVDRYIYH